MEAKDFQALVDQLGGLTKEQREALIEAVEVRASANDAVGLMIAALPPRHAVRIASRSMSVRVRSPSR